MIDTLLLLVIGVLIVLPVVAILGLAAQRVLGATWDARIFSAASLLITVVVVVAYLLATSAA